MATMKLDENTWLVNLDSRGRVSLGCLAKPSTRYHVEQTSDGTIILTPVETVRKTDGVVVT